MYRPTYELHSFTHVTPEEKHEILKAVLKALVLMSGPFGAPLIYVGHAKTDK